MATFDGWEEQLYGHRLPNGPDTLCHFRTKGSKNGVRRYQLEDGTWTPLGLRERKAREGWGDREKRREAKRQAKADRKAQRAARIEAYREERRKANPKYMTEEELQKRINHLKMEQEYRELAKSPLLKAGENFVAKYLENKAIKAERAYNEHQQKLEREYELKKLAEQTKQTELRSTADKARADADKSRAETDKVDIEKGTRMAKLKNERSNLKLQGKRHFSDNTILGGARKLVNHLLSATGEGHAETIKEVGFARGVVKAKTKIDRKNARINWWNRRKDAWETPIEKLKQDPDPWNREKNRQQQQKKNKKGKNGGE